MMANVIKVALKINVDDFGEPLHQPMYHPIQRLMRCTFGPVTKRACIKVSFKDWLQDQLYCSLNNPILDSGNSESTSLAVAFGYFYPPVLARTVGPCKKLPLNFSVHLLYASYLNGLKALPLEPRRPVIGFCLSIRRS